MYQAGSAMRSVEANIEVNDVPPGARTRQTWTRPTLRTVPARGAETGDASITDGSSGFS
jgi:hypothetical protein